MADATTEFMNELGRRGHDPLLQKVNETVRFDLSSGKKIDRWLVRIANGDVTVSHKGGAADTVISADRKLFDRLAHGEANPVASPPEDRADAVVSSTTAALTHERKVRITGEASD